MLFFGFELSMVVGAGQEMDNDGRRVGEKNVAAEEVKVNFQTPLGG